MKTNKNLLIYVVEDNKIYNRMVVEYLEKQGFKRVKSFYCGKDCLDAVEAGESPDIVIQDYFLDDINGIDVLLRVKEKSEKSEFIFLTTNENVEVATNSIKFGAFDYLIKDNDLALRKVMNKIDKISQLIELEKRNTIIKSAMIVSLAILIGIVIFTILNTYI